MTEVAARELRNRTRQLLERVNAGETVVITLDGRPAAQLLPVPGRPRFLDHRSFAARVLVHQADPGLADDLALLAPGTTDDLPW